MPIDLLAKYISEEAVHLAVGLGKPYTVGSGSDVLISNLHVKDEDPAP